MRVGFRNADFDALEKVWRAYFPPRWAVDAEIIRLNTVESPVFDWGASAIAIPEGAPSGFVAVKRSGSPTLWKGSDHDQAHLSAIVFDEANVGVDLLAEAKRNLRNRGFHRLVFGQDSRHFFAGCPADLGNLRSFLTVEGFEEGEGDIFDLESDLGDYEPKKGCLDVLGDWPGCLSPAVDKPVVRPVEAKEAAQLEEFLKREFPGRWLYDTMSKIALESTTDFVYGLYVDGRIEGFSSTQNAAHKVPVNACVFHEAMGPNWGGLGPIGVSAAVRGKGLGDALLGASLLGLQRRGVRQTVIDWTGLVDFYGGHGFKVTRRYKTFVLSL